MERICTLLNDALTPYQVQLDDMDGSGHRQLTLIDARGTTVLRRSVSPLQLQDQRLLVDLVDGLHRDLQIVEGRLQPCVIAALSNQPQPRGTFA
ncbi:DUF3509 domain-containing protein [Pseudomonas sp. S75]|uniref:DUF3509 domain-containing protein n=1 Tax=unclassified Pseudomonas TaxID=196821 RepID=UPI001907A7C0|nr:MULTISPECIES: DUF3509 domain-containing protein [unclassified Pseudomonas]MBJ9976069.1 DUF3509 domain-containing protein [Pseudomonas sp. S30]MBK0153509.1 DUF3509 domain-containing protein [Pseudomonas sp. S75]